MLPTCSNKSILDVRIGDNNRSQPAVHRTVPQVSVQPQTKGIPVIDCHEIQTHYQTSQNTSTRNPTVTRQISSQQADPNLGPPCFFPAEFVC